MGRKKRTLHPWSSRELARATCLQALGDVALAEALEAYRLVAQEKSEFRPVGEKYVPWMADLLFLVEARRQVRITGGLATLLRIASGARPLASKDHFDRHRKNWDEALRRARKRETFVGPSLATLTVARAHWLMLDQARRDAPRSPPSPEAWRAVLAFELDQLTRAASRLSEARLKRLVEKVSALRLATLRK